MKTWLDIAKDYAIMGAPYIVPPMALLLATFVFKFLLSNKQTRKYAKLIMNLMQSKLESSLGAEKSKQVMDAWNDVIKEIEGDPNAKSKTYSQNYFLTRLKNVANLSTEEEESVRVILAWMGDKDVSASSEENYQLPQLPCPCEM